MRHCSFFTPSPKIHSAVYNASEEGVDIRFQAFLVGKSTVTFWSKVTSAAKNLLHPYLVEKAQEYKKISSLL